jgi:hypothetical protein
MALTYTATDTIFCYHNLPKVPLAHFCTPSPLLNMQQLKVCDDIYHVHPTTVSDEVSLKLIFLKNWAHLLFANEKMHFSDF